MQQWFKSHGTSFQYSLDCPRLKMTKVVESCSSWPTRLHPWHYGFPYHFPFRELSRHSGSYQHVLVPDPFNHFVICRMERRSDQTAAAGQTAGTTTGPPTAEQRWTTDSRRRTGPNSDEQQQTEPTGQTAEWPEETTGETEEEIARDGVMQN
mgnify:FL=1